MNEVQFRSSSTNRQRLRELLTDPVFVAASGIIVDANLAIDASLKDDPIVSVRVLSQRAGIEAAFQRLHLMCESIEEAKEPARSDFGAPEAAANLDALEKGLPPPFNAT